jgi:hypothetical protein
MTVKCEVFKSSSKSWETLAEEAASFATKVGPKNLINISVAAAGGTDLMGTGAQGCIFVWFWE